MCRDPPADNSPESGTGAAPRDSPVVRRLRVPGGRRRVAEWRGRRRADGLWVIFANVVLLCVLLMEPGGAPHSLAHEAYIRKRHLLLGRGRDAHRQVAELQHDPRPRPQGARDLVPGEIQPVRHARGRPRDIQLELALAAGLLC